MAISKREVDGVSIVDVTGKIVLDNSHELRSAVRELVEAGKKKILLNLEGVTYVDSSGLGEIVSCYSTAQRQEGKLKLEKLQPKLQDLLTITRLLEVFETFREEAEAVKSFA